MHLYGGALRMRFRGPSSAYVGSRVFALANNAQNLDDPARTPHTKKLHRLRCIIFLYRIPRRPAEIFTPLPPCRTPKDRVSDIAAFPLSELTV